jgi:hypothetical protein
MTSLRKTTPRNQPVQKRAQERRNQILGGDSRSA